MKSLALGAMVALVVLVTACSSSSDSAPTGSSASSSTSTEATSTTVTPSTDVTTGAPQLESSVRAYTEAFLGGDAEASRALLSSRCQGDTSATQWKSIVTRAATEYGDATITTYSEDVDGQLAVATYELSDPVLNQTAERWILEQGEWRNDDCS